VTFFIWVERQFQGASNGTSPTSKFFIIIQVSTKQLDVQNLPRFRVTNLLGLKPKLWVQHPWSPPTLECPSSHILCSCRKLVFCLVDVFKIGTFVMHCNCHTKSFCCDPRPLFFMSSTVSTSSFEWSARTPLIFA
jgi:hypothetical protein